MAIDYAALTAELASSHPVTGAYNADAQLAADELNAVNIDTTRASMTGSEIWAATDPAEYDALTDTAKNQWLAFCAIETHDPAVGGLAQSFVTSIFGASTTTNNLSALRTQAVSRVSQLNLGVGTVTKSHVQTARGEI